ncbi:MAG: hypothetical protein ISQ26_09730 [Candidatus Puniceispirillum sp.]|nr:hypothetical protein [Candidatus Puniceispirillum sp.]
MVRAGLLIPLIMTTTAGIYPASAADSARRDISCGNYRYIIEKSLFGVNVNIMNINDNIIASTERPYCQSNPDAQMVAELSVDGDDIWCVEKFFIVMDRKPIAKTSRLLNLTLDRVFEYDYLWQASDWVKADTRTITCASHKEPKMQKIPD